ncbi:protocadherin Fat 4 [Synchiropus splendidus]|uniref:protocadherin Fat 4 n=1 Tax=Synchiropus splendidus TaxID=270530 RepID=UPI00237E79AB|nr:protocadherin Fat 4 [Synchiropus splendidus]
MSLNIHVEDAGENPKFDATTIRIQLRNESHFPFVDVDVLMRSPFENEPVGTIVAVVSAGSFRAEPVSFHVANGNHEDQFYVDPLDGTLTVANPLDFEAKKEITLLIEARDSGLPPFSSYAEIHINISDVNDNVPHFTQAEYRCEVLENLPPSWVCDVLAIDADSISYAAVLYNITGGNTDNSFILDPESGMLSTSRSLDREYIAVYSLTVEAVELDNPAHKDNASIIVVVLDMNDNAPLFAQVRLTADVPEDCPVGHSVLQITSTDEDVGANAAIFYSISDLDSDVPFDINSTSGYVMVKRPLDREMQALYIARVIANDSQWSVSAVVTIAVTDVNDNPPIFAAQFYTVTVAEVREVDVVVLRVEATDADRGQNGKIVYFIAPQNEDFWVNNTSGQIHAKQHLTLDGLAFKIYQFIVVAFDCGSNPLFSNSTIQVRVEPFNRYPPMFLPFATPIAIPNDVSLNRSVAEIRAIDPDLSNSSAAVDYFAIGGNASDLFWIQGGSGKVMLRQSLAGSVNSYLTLIVLAKDRGCPSLEAQTQMTFEVTGRNLFTPHFNPPVATFLIPEDLPVGSVIRRIQAEDGDEGLNGVVLYRVTSGHQLLPFSVGDTTGLITLTGEVDFEEHWDYSFQIHATDRGWESKTGILNITIQVVDVNDNPPVFLASEYVTSVLENSPVGTRIMDLSAYDADSGANAEIIYSLVAGHVDRFEINSNNGTLTTLHVFDYEKEQVFDVTVKAINNNNPALLSLVHVIIQISDVNEFEPTFTQEVYDFSVLKNAPLGSRIGKVTATDSDRGVRGQVFYLVIGRNGGFKVDKHSGEIYTAISLRSHSNSQVILKVLAKNSGVVTGDDVDEAVVRIQVMDINDPPVFSADVYMADIAEDSLTGASVITLEAEDHDSIFDWNYFRFKIEGGNTNLSFSVDPLSGVISVMSPLDREHWPLYNLTVTATDNGFPTATSSAHVIIRVTDVNDNAPKLTFTEAQVRENEPRGAFVAKMNVTDSDSPPNQGPFTFWLVNTSSSRLFSLTPDGVLFTTQTFDREHRAAYQVLVAVRDAGLPSMSSTSMFHIQVEDDNDNPPSPRNIFIEVKYFGSSFDGGMIGHVHPEDQDEHDIFVCSVKNGPASMFTIPNGTCQLWSSPFQGEATFNMTIEATDQRHFPVNNSVYVNYKGFTNATMDSCVLFYLSSISMQQFMSFNYLRFVKALDSLFNLQASKTHVFGIKQIGDEILLLAAVKNYNGQYLSRESASDISAGHRRLLESQSNVTISHILSDPCLRSLCQNGGMCTKNIHISQEVAVLESTAVIFVSPRKEIFNCTCPPGFVGQLCEDDVDECQVNPCKNEGTCVNTEGGFHCYCPDGFSGTVCLFHEDDCLKCQNGGSCTLSHDGYHCVCVPGFEGKTCDHEVDYCDSHPCVQGSCVNSQTGFSCHCPYGVTGVHCENPCYGFQELSFMEFPPLHHTRNLISLEFATVQNNSLLLFNSGGSSSRDYLALEILNGSVSLTFDLGSEPMRLQMTKEVADGKFHSVVVRRNGNMASLHVDNCTEEGDGFCFLQREGSSSEKTLDVNDNNMTVGGLRSVASLSLSSAPVQTHDFVGCIRNIYVNGIVMRLSTALAANNVLNSCPQKTESPCHSDPCQNGGECRDVWSDYLCVCGDNFTGRNCNTEIPSQLVVRFHGDGFIEFAIKEKFRRTYLVNHHVDEDVDTVAEVELKTKHEGILMSMNSLTENIAIQIKNRRLVLTFHDLEPGVLSDFTVVPAVADGRWHRLSLFISEDKTSVSLDGKVALSISNRRLSLTAFTVQKVVLGSSGDANLQQPGFSGCVRHLAVFGNTLLLSGPDDMVEVRPTATLIQSTCTSSDFCFPTDCWGGNTSSTTFCPHESCPHTCGNNRSCICLGYGKFAIGAQFL